MKNTKKPDKNGKQGIGRMALPFLASSVSLPAQALRAGIPISRGQAVITEVPDITWGMTGYLAGQVESVTVPVATTAYQRTIRVHEHLHATKTPIRQRKPKRGGVLDERAMNAIEDLYVQGPWFSAIKSEKIHRDAVCAALQDLRAIVQNPPKTTKQYNDSLGAIARSFCILIVSGPKTMHAIKVVRSMISRVCESVISEHVRTTMNDIIYHVVLADPGHTAIKYRKAVKSFQNMYLPEESGSQNEPHTPGGPHPDHDDGTGCQMEIVDRPKSIPCHATTAGIVSASTGVRLVRPKKLVGAIFRGSSRIFRRRAPTPPRATILIDASGSMLSDDDILACLCGLAPGALVAYYCGSDGNRGRLTIYARGGRRDHSVTRIGQWNTVDLPALCWLLAQIGPRYFVTDRLFSSGAPGNAERAGGMLASAEACGMVTVIPTIYHAISIWDKE